MIVRHQKPAGGFVRLSTIWLTNTVIPVFLIGVLRLYHQREHGYYILSSMFQLISESLKAEKRANARAQDVTVEWLGQEVVRSSFNATDADYC
jgi:hypothetical protein